MKYLDAFAESFIEIFLDILLWTLGILFLLCAFSSVFLYLFMKFSIKNKYTVIPIFILILTFTFPYLL